MIVLIIAPARYIEEVARLAPQGMKSLHKDQQRRIRLMHLQGKTLQYNASAFMSIDNDDVDSLFDELHTCVAWLVHEVGRGLIG
jgi:hypothetical protein